MYDVQVTFLVIEKFPDPDPAYLKRKGKVAWMADTESWCASERSLPDKCGFVLHTLCLGRLSDVALHLALAWSVCLVLQPSQRLEAWCASAAQHTLDTYSGQCYVALA